MSNTNRITVPCASSRRSRPMTSELGHSNVSRMSSGVHWVVERVGRSRTRTPGRSTLDRFTSPNAPLQTGGIYRRLLRSRWLSNMTRATFRIAHSWMSPMTYSLDSRRLLRRSVVPLLLAAVALAPFANAQSSVVHPRMHAHHHGLSDKMLLAIGATPDQRAKILAIQNQARADRQAQRQTNGNVRLQMAQALAAPTVDPSAAEAARQKMLAQIDAASQRRLQARLMVAAVLTPDQRQQLLQLQQQHRRKS
jgi:Spy/CpxP family protein refolding chaperone